MIRKAIIVVLTFAAVMAGTMWLLSYLPLAKRFHSQVGPLRISAGMGSWYVAAITNERPNAGLWMRGKRGRLELGRHHRIPLGTMRAGLKYEAAGFGFTRTFQVSSHARSATEYVTITASAWAPFLVFATYPAICFISGPLKRLRKRRQGLCTQCGYDLTGNVSGVCPECGTEGEQS